MGNLADKDTTWLARRVEDLIRQQAPGALTNSTMDELTVVEKLLVANELELSTIAQKYLAAIEPWREVGASEQPGFTSPWVNFDTSPLYRPAKFRKNVLDQVELRGLCASGTTGANGQTIFTLPEGYRPVMVSSSVGMTFTTSCFNGATAVYGTVAIYSDGRVTPYLGNVFGAGTGLWLDGINFNAS